MNKIKVIKFTIKDTPHAIYITDSFDASIGLRDRLRQYIIDYGAGIEAIEEDITITEGEL
jgi:hypothetical protein